MSIWNTVRANIRAGIKWAFSSDEDLEDKSEDSGVIRRKVEPKPVTKPKTTTKRVRARTIKGRYKGDDKSTPDVDEAWTTTKVPVRRVDKTKK
jgi:hypothetical protein